MLIDSGRSAAQLLSGFLLATLLVLVRLPESARAQTPDLAELLQQAEHLLLPDGHPRLSDRHTTAALAELASQAGQLAGGTDHAAKRLLAEALRLKLFAALAHQALLEQQPSQASYRLTQLRASAAQIRRVPRTEAQPLADWWFLLADLMDTQRNQPDAPARRQAQRARLDEWLTRTAQPEQALPPPLARLRPIALARAAELAHLAADHARARELASEGLADSAGDDPTQQRLKAALDLEFQLNQPLPAPWLRRLPSTEKGNLILWADARDLLNAPATLEDALDQFQKNADEAGFSGSRVLLLTGPWPIGANSAELAELAPFLSDLPAALPRVMLSGSQAAAPALPRPAPGHPRVLRTNGEGRLQAMAASAPEALAGGISPPN